MRLGSSESRIGVLGAVFLAAVGAVATHLFVVMVVDHDIWAARSHRNRWAFRSVPSQRGAIHDRHGQVLVRDEPTLQVMLYYQRFRTRHPVGAAVHGATTWANLQPGRELVNYSYAGFLGPDRAVRDLLAMPVSVLRRGELGKDDRARLATAVTTVLAATSGMPRRVVYQRLRDAAEQQRVVRCGAVLEDFSEIEVLVAFDRLHRALVEFDRLLLSFPEMQATHRKHRPGLITRLDWQRVASLQRVTVKIGNADGTTSDGDLYESMEWPVAEYVPFEMAAPLQVGARTHPGLRVRPGVQRQSLVPEDSSLGVSLGTVKEIGRSEPDQGWIERNVVSELPDDWLEDMVPDDAAVNLADRERMQQNAALSFQRLTRRFERRGMSGIEASCDRELSGRLGMRLIERDSQQREQLMWSSMRVESGDDVAITIDLKMQILAESIVEAARSRALARHGALDDATAARVQAAIAVIDATSGDVLAFAGAPSKGRMAATLPGSTWTGNGSLGSVVKPFVLLEQLLAEQSGRPHVAMSTFEACSGEFRYGGRVMRCEGHWDEGKSPVRAIAKSCNHFFYQASLGLRRDGLTRAFQRVGLVEAGVGSDFEACWQPRVRGMPWASPRDDRQALPASAIGYGVAASPAAVARAYAALATARLPTLGLVRGERRPYVEFGGIDAELDLIRSGLEQCVTEGTANSVPALARFKVMGKTGTAEIGEERENNAWFAGYLPWTASEGVQLCFCAVVYWVPDGDHGADAAGAMIAQLLEGCNAQPALRQRYITPGGGR